MSSSHFSEKLPYQEVRPVARVPTVHLYRVSQTKRMYSRFLIVISHSIPQIPECNLEDFKVEPQNGSHKQQSQGLEDVAYS